MDKQHRHAARTISITCSMNVQYGDMDMQFKIFLLIASLLYCGESNFKFEQLGEFNLKPKLDIFFWIYQEPRWVWLMKKNLGKNLVILSL
jgi:hypothetical protein